MHIHWFIFINRNPKFWNRQNILAIIIKALHQLTVTKSMHKRKKRFGLSINSPMIGMRIPNGLINQKYIILFPNLNMLCLSL